jgi:two-component system, OmpR family, Ni(II)-responsive and/or redox-responsive regulator NrsR
MEALLARLRALQRRSPQLQSQVLTVGKFSLDYANNALFVATDTQDSQEPQSIPLTT